MDSNIKSYQYQIIESSKSGRNTYLNPDIRAINTDFI